MIAAIVISILLVILLILYRKEYGRRLRKKRSEVGKSNKEIASLLQQGHMQLWTYDINTGIYSWMDEGRAVMVVQQPKDFAARYSQKVFQHIKENLQILIRGEEESKTLCYAQNMKDGSKRYFALNMSLVRRHPQGPANMIATYQYDITEIYRREQRDKETRMRYESIFNSSVVDMIYYDGQGRVASMNNRGSKTFGLDLEIAKQKGPNIETTINEPGFDHRHFDIFHATQLRPSELVKSHVKSQKLQGLMCYEIQVAPVYDDRQRMVCAYGSGLDVTEVADTYYTMQENIRQIEQANKALVDYVRNIDFAMKVGGIRIVEYHLDTRTLTIYKETDIVQLTITAERAMRFVDSTSRNIVKHMFDSMDNHTENPFNSQIKTIIRQPEGQVLHLYVYFMPTYNKQKEVTGYFGMMRDFTEAKIIERQLANATIHARQEEAQKNNFMRNMSFEIRTLLNGVVGFADLFMQEHSANDEEAYISQLKSNGVQLLELVNGILLLSRLGAGMVESVPRSTDLAMALDSWCHAGYDEHRKEGVQYLVEHSYEHFTADIDAVNLGIVVTQLCSNGARLTAKGCVRTYYNYTDGQLSISVESHGKGLTAKQLENIFDYFGSAMETGTALSLPICHSMMELLGGSIDIKSDVGHETTITVTLPCQPTELVPVIPTAKSKTSKAKSKKP